MADQKAKRKCEVGGGHEYHSSVQVTAIVGNLWSKAQKEWPKAEGAYRSVKKIVLASEEEWRKLKGMGKKTAADIVAAIEKEG